MQNQKTRVLVEIALCATISTILDIVIPSPSFAFKISVKMLPIIILALRRGLIPGLAGGFLWGLLQVVLGDAQILTIFQFVIEYFVAFALVGLAGLVHKPMQASIRNKESTGKQIGLASGGLIIGSFARYLIHFAAGILFWSEYAPENQGAVLYSFIVNGGAFLSETATCLVVLILLGRFYDKLILVN